VSDAEAAIRIALDALEPTYGQARIENEQPFRAWLMDGVWIVEGTFPAGKLGRPARVEVLQRDGAVIGVSHL
jgi:hypothetical protein